MNQHELLIKLSSFKSNLQHLIKKFKSHSSNEELQQANFDGVDNFVDDLPLTINRDPRPDDENSRESSKERAQGIDSFGEENTFDFDEADDFQTNRDRNQNSDLSKRFATDGMELEDFNDQ